MIVCAGVQNYLKGVTVNYDENRLKNAQYYTVYGWIPFRWQLT